jgi:hypothetical protein
MTSRPVTKLWESCSAGNLLDERVTRQLVATRVAPYVEPIRDKARGEPLRESLLGE